MSQISTLDRLSALDTNTVSDALDFLGLKGATYGLRPLWDCHKIVGRASTVKLGVKANDEPTKHLITPVIDATMTDDRILVISGGAEGVSCWGDILGNASKLKGIRGTVIDGASRDIDGMRDLDYPVYGRGVTMISARNRVVQVESGGPLQMQGVTVHQDDYVVADNCGTVFVPARHIDQVLQYGERIDNRQSLMTQAVLSGQPVTEVMHDKQFDKIRGTGSTALRSDSKREDSDKSIRADCEDKELVALFSGTDTASVSDALDKLGISGQACNIMPLANYNKTVVGPAFTIRYVPASDPPGSVGDFIDDVAAGDFVVIDNGGRTDCTVWGDIMTQYAALKGISGTVIDGVCRDVSRALSEDYPLFTKGRWMRTGKDRVQVGGINDAVGIGNVRVESRDIVVADTNGVVIVPRGLAREVAAWARKIEEVEAGIRDMITRGITITEAREKMNYHALQRKNC